MSAAQSPAQNFEGIYHIFLGLIIYHILYFPSHFKNNYSSSRIVRHDTAERERYFFFLHGACVRY